MSLFFVPHLSIASLVAIERYLGLHQRWQSINDPQRELIRGTYAERSDLGYFSEQELKTYAGQSAAKINETLKSAGFDIRLGELGPDGVGAVSIMKIVFEWIAQATKSQLRSGKETFAALKFKEGYAVFASKEHESLIVRLETSGGYEVFVTESDRKTTPTDGFALRDMIERVVSSSRKISSSSFDFFKMPKIKANENVDISWLIGMKIARGGGKYVVIEQAKEQVKLETDTKGAKVEAAAALGTRGGEYGLTIDKPFLMLIRKKGLKNGILYGLVDSASWAEEIPK